MPRVSVSRVYSARARAVHRLDEQRIEVAVQRNLGRIIADRLDESSAISAASRALTAWNTSSRERQCR